MKGKGVKTSKKADADVRSHSRRKRCREDVEDGCELLVTGDGGNNNSSSAAVGETEALLSSLQERYSSHSGWQNNSKDSKRFDFPKTVSVNELVKNNPRVSGGTSTMQKKASLGKRSKSKKQRDDGSNAAGVPVPAFQWNLVANIVYPLHNALQKCYGHHNDDEIQVMLVEAPVSVEKRGAETRKESPSKRKHKQNGNKGRESESSDIYSLGANEHNGNSRAATPQQSSKEKHWHCFVATNSEKISQEQLDYCTVNWKALEAWKISQVKMVHGEAGRHAEQKLLELFDSSEFRIQYGFRDFTPQRSGPCDDLCVGGKKQLRREKRKEGEARPLVRSGHHETGSSPVAMIVGERLPCATCAIFAHLHETSRPYVQLLQTHGHFYLKTVPFTPGLEIMSADDTFGVMRQILSQEKE